VATRADALAAVRTILEYIGEDPYRPGLAETPDRYIRAWEEDHGRFYFVKETERLVKLFPAELGENGCYDQMVTVRNISITSTCEHHLAPFFGRAHIAYLPSAAGIVGISKLARVATHFASRLQTQERLTENIADFLELKVANDVAIMLECEHTCMMTRGVRQPEAVTITTGLRGIFRDDPGAKSEFLRTIGK